MVVPGERNASGPTGAVTPVPVPVAGVAFASEAVAEATAAATGGAVVVAAASADAGLVHSEHSVKHSGSKSSKSYDKSAPNHIHTQTDSAQQTRRVRMPNRADSRARVGWHTNNE